MDKLHNMYYGWQDGGEMLAYFLNWVGVALFTIDSVGAVDAAALLAVFLIAFGSIALFSLVWRSSDRLFRVGAVPRGPTGEELRLRGAFRRQSRPCVPGRPQPRAPGPPAGAAQFSPA